ncbi:hypothetical protein Mapa_012071 [Marchantia paleacea]|nr:hypothetical protein Mapa_012071 [Marchantia paleacea]
MYASVFPGTLTLTKKKVGKCSNREAELGGSESGDERRTWREGGTPIKKTELITRCRKDYNIRTRSSYYRKVL